MCGCNHKEIDFELSRLHSLISEKDRQIELLKARCCNDDLTLDMNSKASVILGKMIGESLDEAAQRVIDDSITLRADLARAREVATSMLIAWDNATEAMGRFIKNNTKETAEAYIDALGPVAEAHSRARAALAQEQRG